MPLPPGHWLRGGFYLGVVDVPFAIHFPRVCISINRLRERRRGFMANSWIMDSGAFTELTKYGRYRHSTDEYARQVRRWATLPRGTMAAAVSQDYMCEPFVLKKTGLTVAEHHRRTIVRYDRLMSAGLPVHVMPVLQGYEPSEYVGHLRQYGDRLTEGMWVGVGSVCKRNANPALVAGVLEAIRSERPDLQLHGFGVKVTALANRRVLRCLYSSDSTAWRLAARMQGRNANALSEARNYWESVNETILCAGGGGVQAVGVVGSRTGRPPAESRGTGPGGGDTPRSH